MTAPTTEQIMRLCDVGRQTGYDLRKYHGHGHLEKVYENGLPHRLRKRGIRVEQQCAIIVLDEDGTPLGDIAFCFFAMITLKK